jgi:hypothetical protein
MPGATTDDLRDVILRELRTCGTTCAQDCATAAKCRSFPARWNSLGSF